MVDSANTWEMWRRSASQECSCSIIRCLRAPAISREVVQICKENTEDAENMVVEKRNQPEYCPTHTQTWQRQLCWRWCHSGWWPNTDKNPYLELIRDYWWPDFQLPGCSADPVLAGPQCHSPATWNTWKNLLMNEKIRFSSSTMFQLSHQMWSSNQRNNMINQTDVSLVLR